MVLNFKLSRNFSQVEFTVDVEDKDNVVDQIIDAYSLLMSIDDLTPPPPAPPAAAGYKTKAPATREPMATKKQLDYIAGLDPYFDKSEHLTMRQARDRINQLKREIEDFEE